jgi:hypothetical protein
MELLTVMRFRDPWKRGEVRNQAQPEPFGLVGALIHEGR